MTNEKEPLAKKLFLQGVPFEKIIQITGLNSTWLELRIQNWKAQAKGNYI